MLSTDVAVDGGGTITSTDRAEGAVAVAVYPWEIALEPADGTAHGASSALNRLAATVTSVTELGNRARVGLAVPAPVAAETTTASVARLGLQRGAAVGVAVFKATATRLIER